MAGKIVHSFNQFVQVMIVKGIAKKYLGAIHSEMKAARLYDKYAMIIQGLSVSSLTNILNINNRLKPTSPIQSKKYYNFWERTMRSSRT